MSKIGYALLVLVLPLAAQTQQQALLVTRIYNITSTWAGECGTGGIDNRSNASRHNNFHSFYVTGSGTWSVTMRYSDTACTGPWTSFGATAAVTQASSLPVGTGFLYHPYVSFSISGSASVTYMAWKDAYPPPGGTGGGGGGISTINGDNSAGQTLVVGTSGTDFAIVDSAGGVHTFNLPTASATARGALSSANWTTFNGKAGTGTCPASQVAIATTTAGVTCVQLGFSDLSGTLTSLSQFAAGILSGDGTKLGTVSGTQTSGKCLEWDATGNIVTAASNAACAAGGGGNLISINGDVTAAQTIATGTSGTDFAIVDGGLGLHTLNLPTASATVRGALSSANWTTFNNKAGTVTCPANQVVIATTTSGGTCVQLGFSQLSGTLTSISQFAAGLLSGNGSKLGTISGTTSAGKCLEWDASGNIVTAVSNAACGSGTATGLVSINSDTTPAQGLVVGSAGSDFNIQHPGSGQHVFNIPTASSSVRGALSSTDWTTFNGKAGVVTCPANQVLIATTTAGGTCVAIGFNTLGTGTNTTATMTVGTGATMTYSGSGVLNASQYKGTTAAGTGACTSGQFVTGLNDAAAPTCGVPSGSGNVTGPATSTQHALAAYADTTGRVLENTAVTYDPAGKQLNLTGSTDAGKMTLYGNTSGSASISVPAVAGTPADLLLPTSTGTAGYVLSTNGANPQQLSWIAASGAVSAVTGTSPIVSSGGTSPDLSCPTCLTSATPGYSGSRLISGGGVAWTGGLNFTVSAATYQILGVQYSSVLSNIALTAADPSQDRIEVIYVDDTGTVGYLPGTPGTPPVKPQVANDSQLELTWAYVAAGASVPSNITSILMYDENVGTPTEWAATASGVGFALASTTNPYHLTKDIEATGVISTNYVQFQTGTPVNLSTMNSLVFYIRSKAAWASKKNLQISALSTGTQIGSTVTLSQGTFGFDSSVTAAYQQIVIPLALFATGSTTVNQFRFTVSGSGTAIGFYLDYIMLQSGLPIPSGAWLTWKGTWSSAVAYNTNDVVISSGTPYVALAASINSTPPSSNWAAMATVGSGTVTTTGTPAANQVAIFSGGTSITGTATDTTTTHALFATAGAPAFRALAISDLPTVSKVQSCQPGLGDGLNAIPAGTYLQSICYNDTGATVTITGIKCFTDNSGTSTMNVTNGANTALLTGAITCTSSWAAGTQSATVTIASGDYLKFTFVADGTSKQTTWAVTETR